MSLTSRCRSLCLSVFLVIVLLLPRTCLVSGLEAKWTANEQDDQGPLPLSQNQRQQLLQLEDTIRSSQDPERTLMQVAESNQMSPEELAGLLQRNRADMEAAGGAVPMAGPKRTNVLVKLVSTVAIMVGQAAKKNPRSFLLTATALLAILYIGLSAPRTGLLLSNRPVLLISKGPTTVWAPPVEYIRERVDEAALLSMSIADEDFTDQLTALLPDDVDEPVWQKGKSKLSPDLARVASAQSSVCILDFASGDDDDDIDEDELNQIMDVALEQASRILEKRDLTEFVVPASSTRLVTLETSGEEAILVVKGMGDWKRYGIQPLQINSEDTEVGEGDEEEDESMSLTFSSLQGGHWDGQLHISVERCNADVLLRASLIFPKGGRALGRSSSLKIVKDICNSMESSLRTRVRQALARRSQSSNFQGKASRKAKKKRHLRFFKEKAIEEMAIDRRRRWQRQNPNSGTYRPSGDRMRSPNNAVY